MAKISVTPLALPEVLLIELQTFEDSRGLFLESYQLENYHQHQIGPFVQDNLSISKKGTLRGMHYQNPTPQGKLVQVLHGSVFDVAVDLRRSSATFGRWVGAVLRAKPAQQLWIPEGFAHGFCALEDDTLFSYKCTAPYDPASEQTILWNDPTLKIEWPIATPLLSSKDASARLFQSASFFS